MRTRHPVRKAAVSLLAAALAIAGGACGGGSARSSARSATVGERGGQYTVGGITVTVPEGSVKNGTTLSVSTPNASAAGDTSVPLTGARQSAVHFDISLSGGAQPAAGKPFEVSVPLEGGYLPAGAQPAHALLYSPGRTGKEWRLVPATVSADGVLHAKLEHLSSKAIVYIDDTQLQELIVSPAVAMGARPDCSGSVISPSTGRLRFGSRSTGWSDNADSPLLVCMFPSGDGVGLSIRNRVNLILSVAATDGLTLSSPASGAEDELARRLADRLFPNPVIRTYLSRNAELTTPLPAASLPATVELRGDPNTFLAEAVFNSVKFLVGIFVGRKSGEVAQDIRNLIEAPDLIDCLRSAVAVAGGNASLADIGELVIGRCTEIVRDKVGELAKDVAAWDMFWQRILVPVEGAVLGWNTVWSALDGIRMQVVGTMRVAVERVPDQNRCPTRDEILTAARAQIPDVLSSEYVVQDSIRCVGPWVRALITNGVSSATLFFRWENGALVLKAAGSDARCPVDANDTGNGVANVEPQYQSICRD